MATSASAEGSVASSVRAAWWVFSPRVCLLLVPGFSSSLPLALVGHTLSAWMTDARVDLTTVGFFSAVVLLYSVKFLWAPAVDQLPGWSTFFFATIAVAVPGVLLVLALPSSLTHIPLQEEPQ